MTRAPGWAFQTLSTKCVWKAHPGARFADR
jgi:hypothetical protein